MTGNSQEILITCPGCRRCAFVRSKETISDRIPSRFVLRCSCKECGHQWKLQPKTDPAGAAIPEIPLWLQTRCRGNILWAFNAEHLDDLQKLVEAKLRSMEANSTYFLPWRLPKWMISAKNREACCAAYDGFAQSYPGHSNASRREKTANLR